jgi:hypothetical protein
VQLADAGKINCRITNPNGVTNSSYATFTVLAQPTQPYPQAVFADNPAAYWRLDETSGTVAHDYWMGHDGVYNSVTLNQTGYSSIDPNPAAAFGGVGKYVGAISGLDFSGTNTSFSLEAWVNGPANQTAGSATIISKGRGGNGAGGVNGMQYSLDVTGGKFRFHVESGSAANDATATVGPDGIWHHVVGTYDYTSGMKIFVDGQAAGSAAAVAGGPIATALPTTIGSGQGGVTPVYDQYFIGTIDEAAVYNVALSEAQVANHFCNQFGGSQRPLILAQPVSQTNYAGWPLKLDVTSAGSCPLIYQWKKGVNPLSDGGTISGASTAHLTISALDVSDAGSYSVNISNTQGNTNSAAAVITVLKAATNALNVPGLVLHLTFDNNLNDTSGHGHNGTGKHTVGTTSPITTTEAPNGSNPNFNYTDGKLGAGLHYASDTGVAPHLGGNNTVGTNDYYVTLGVVPELKFSSNVDFSVSYWVRLPNFYDLGDLPFFTDATGSTGGKGFTFAPSYGSNGVFAAGTEANSGSWAWAIDNALNVGVRTEGPWYAINDGAYHHLVHTYSRTGNGITYLDGVQVDSRSVASVTDMSNNNPAIIGQDPTGQYAENGSADIDDLGVFRRALSPLEARGLFVAATNGASFLDITPTIKTGPGANQVTITWNAGTLQQADEVTGPYTDVPGPPANPLIITLTPSTTLKFYRTHYYNY